MHFLSLGQVLELSNLPAGLHWACGHQSWSPGPMQADPSVMQAAAHSLVGRRLGRQRVGEQMVSPSSAVLQEVCDPGFQDRAGDSMWRGPWSHPVVEPS